MKYLLTALLLMGTSVPSFATVTVSTPIAGTVGPKVPVVGSATSTCEYGVSAMGVYVDNQLEQVEYGSSIDKTIPLTQGKHNIVVQDWDGCGGYGKKAIEVTVADSGVNIVSPVDGAKVNWNTVYKATASTTCAKGVSAMGLYVDNALVYTVAGANMDTPVNLPAGRHNTAVTEWDGCGGASTQTVSVDVQNSGQTFTDLQSAQGWGQYGQKAPDYSDCSPCSGVEYSFTQGQENSSLSGHAAQWWLGGSTPYSDVLFNNHLIGPFSSQGLPDTRQQLLSQYHNFSYDLDFYVEDAHAAQALEFDINWFQNQTGLTWGTECRIDGGQMWDVWDSAHWVSTGLACNPVIGGWNHVEVNAQRGPQNQLVYQSIVLNGAPLNLNKTYPGFKVPADWYGITVNYQMDGNSSQDQYGTYTDNMTLRYW